MAIYKPPIPKLYKDEDGKLQIETHEEMMDRIKKEEKEQYERDIKEIMKNDFTRKQAEYLHRMNKKFYDAIQPRIY